MKILRILSFLAMGLAFLVVMLGAYTRLTHAGLGCPDWPGCYGKVLVPTQVQDQRLAQKNFPSIPIEARKAWTEMIHRYIAGTLVLFIIGIAALAWRYRRQGAPLITPVFLLILIGFQAALGMWTVTLKLLPVVVMGHLLGGIGLFAGLIYLNLKLHCNSPKNTCKDQLSTYGGLSAVSWLSLGIGIVVIQIALGGWVSSNYAGLACVGFPQCNGQWLPHLNWHTSFQFWSSVGLNHQGGLLDITSRITIQMVHRLGAILTVLYLGTVATVLLCKSYSTAVISMATMVLICVLIQFSLGMVNVLYMLPLWAAVAHNGVAALLLASVLCLRFIVSRQDSSHAHSI